MTYDASQMSRIAGLEVHAAVAEILPRKDTANTGIQHLQGKHLIYLIVLQLIAGSLNFDFWSMTGSCSVMLHKPTVKLPANKCSTTSYIKWLPLHLPLTCWISLVQNSQDRMQGMV